MSGVLVTIELPAEPRQQFTDPLLAVLRLLRALEPEQLNALKLHYIRQVEQSRLVGAPAKPIGSYREVQP